MTLATEKIKSLVPASDGELLDRYVRQGDQQAFRELVGRHVDWLYATALRLTGNAALAEDVTQGVLLALSRKARALANRHCLAGWLFEASRCGARALLRAEMRRRERETMYAKTAAIVESPPAWDDLKDRFDAAVARLPASDREVLVRRFYQRMTHEAVATAMGISEEAARKRVTRALNRLRRALSISASAPALGAALDTIPTVAAPAHLLPQVLAGTVSAKALLIAKGVSLMAFASKLKIAVAVSALTLFSGYLVSNYVFAQAGPAAQTGGGLGTNANPAVSGGTGRGSGGVRADGSAVDEVFDGTNDFIFTREGVATTLVIKDAAGRTLFDGPYTTADDKARIPANFAAEIARLASLPGGGRGGNVGQASVGGGRGGGGARSGTVIPGNPPPGSSGAVSGGGVRGGMGPNAVNTSFRSDGTTSVRRYTDATHDIAFTETGGNTTVIVKDSAGTVLFDGPYTTDADKAKVPAGLADKVTRLFASLPAGSVGRGGAQSSVTSSNTSQGAGRQP